MNIKEAEVHLQESLKNEMKPYQQFNYKAMLGIHGNTENEICLYGAGKVGHIAYHQFTEQGIKIKAFIDKCGADSALDLPVPVFTPEGAAMNRDIRESIVFLSLVKESFDDYHQIQEYLKHLGIKNVIYDIDYVVQGSMFYQYLSNNSLLQENMNSIKKSLSFMDDDISRDVFCGFMRACNTKKFREHIITTHVNEYDPQNTPAPKRCNNFIDAGAYTGDSLKKVLEFHQEIKNYVGFEPDWVNFAQLSVTVEHQSTHILSANIYPCAIGRDNQTVSFLEENNVNSRVAKVGKKQAPMLRIDDAVRFRDKGEYLLIKMDVEGMELDALYGAEKTIRLHKPDLMICVYHRISDFWTIPLYLQSIVPEYRMNMRCYTVFGGETILYASCQ